MTEERISALVTRAAELHRQHGARRPWWRRGARAVRLWGGYALYRLRGRLRNAEGIE